MGRILAIDYGKKRVGLAVTDPLKIIANGLTTVASNEIFGFIKKYLAENDVECIVVGYPKTLRNEPSESIRYINPFIKGLTNKFKDVKIEIYDERFTSKIAFDAMLTGGVKKKDRQRKELIDEISATLILQSYMEYLKHRNL